MKFCYFSILFGKDKVTRKLLGTTLNGFLMNGNYTTTIITKQNKNQMMPIVPGTLNNTNSLLVFHLRKI